MSIFRVLAVFLLCLTLTKSQELTQEEYQVLLELDYYPPYFSLAGMTFLGKVDYVIDGDSVKISLFFHNELTRFNCHL